MADSALLKAFREHEWELLRFLGQRLGSRAMASDAVQDLYVKLATLDPAPQVRDCRAYLFGMAANLARDRMRVDRRRGEILAEIDGIVWRRRDELTPERHVLARAELQHIQDVIAALPERCREVFRLYRFEGLSQAQIAARLGLGLTTVYKDLKRAMRELTAAREAFRRSHSAGPDGEGAPE